jgi:hypothetical protein
MATNAISAIRAEEPARISKPPRFPAPVGSLAALAQKHEPDAIDMATGWVLLWQACGGAVATTPDGKRATIMPEPARRRADCLRPIGFCPANEAEWRGATMALAALLFLAGPSANDAVFDHAEGVEA